MTCSVVSFSLQVDRGLPGSHDSGVRLGLPAVKLCSGPGASWTTTVKPWLNAKQGLLFRAWQSATYCIWTNLEEPDFTGFLHLFFFYLPVTETDAHHRHVRLQFIIAAVGQNSSPEIACVEVSSGTFQKPSEVWKL